MAPNNKEESEIHSLGFNNVCGIDESGCGCLAGNVVMGAVIFPIDIDYKNLLPYLNDSKQKTSEQRETLYEQIKQHSLCYSFAYATVEEIDKLNIYWAKFLAARRAIDALTIKPDYILMDGNKIIPDISIPQKAIVKGDCKCISISAASIIAKCERDKHINELAKLVHEDYEWIKNKSYYSEQHIAAIKKYGKTVFHREKYVRKFLM